MLGVLLKRLHEGNAFQCFPQWHGTSSTQQFRGQYFYRHPVRKHTAYEQHKHGMVAKIKLHFLNLRISDSSKETPVIWGTSCLGSPQTWVWEVDFFSKCRLNPHCRRCLLIPSAKTSKSTKVFQGSQFLLLERSISKMTPLSKFLHLISFLQ